MRLKALFPRLRGVRGLEWLAATVALALLGLALLNGGATRSAEVRTDLETRLEDVLSRVEGAGRVRVLIAERQEIGEMQAGADEGGVGGVLVVAEGAGDVRVRLLLSNAVRSVLNVELKNIEIIEMRRD